MKELDYKKIAKTIVEKLQETIRQTISSGTSPDLYWKLEKAIEDALKYVAHNTEQRVRKNITGIIKEFDDDDGPTHN